MPIKKMWQYADEANVAKQAQQQMGFPSTRKTRTRKTGNLA
jgi:hypothetical protein